MEMPVVIEHKPKDQKSAGRDKLKLSLIYTVLDLCYVGRSVVKSKKVGRAGFPAEVGASPFLRQKVLGVMILISPSGLDFSIRLAVIASTRVSEITP